MTETPSRSSSSGTPGKPPVLFLSGSGDPDTRQAAASPARIPACGKDAGGKELPIPDPDMLAGKPAGGRDAGRDAPEGACLSQKPPESKGALVLKLLRRKSGATVWELCAATGWQPHSVRGHLSAVVRKRLGLALLRQSRKDGTASYRIGT